MREVVRPEYIIGLVAAVVLYGGAVRPSSNDTVRQCSLYSGHPSVEYVDQGCDNTVDRVLVDGVPAQPDLTRRLEAIRQSCPNEYLRYAAPRLYEGCRTDEALKDFLERIK